MPVRRCCTAIVVALVCLLLLPSGARAQRSKRIGVVVGLAVNLDSESAWQLSDDLAATIDTTFDLDTVSGREARRRLPDGQVPDECVANAECRTDIGRRLEADELVFLVVVQLGDEIRIDPTWAHVASGDVVGRSQIVLSSSADRNEVLSEAVPSVLPHEKKVQEPTNNGSPTIVVQPMNTTTTLTSGNQGSQPSRGPGLGFYLAGGTSLATLVAGGVLAVSADSRYADLERRGCLDVVCDPKELDALRTRALAADILLGVSAASALTAGYFYFSRGGSSKSKGKEKEMPLSLQIGSERATIGVRGSF